MVNIFTAYKPVMRAMMKLVGLSPRKVEIEPGTVMNVWAPTDKTDKPAVVLLQGFTGDGMLTWQLQALSLSRDYSVYVPDLIFFGESTSKSSRRTVGFQAECVVEALKQLGARMPLTVVGLSYGGMIGFELARTRPDVVGSLVATCTVPTLTESLTAECLARMGGLFHTWSDLLLPETVQGVRLLLEIGTYKLPGWIPNWIFRHFLEVMFNNRKEKAELLEALVIPDDKDPNKVPHFPQMVHILSGENDKIFESGIAKALKEKLGNGSTLQLIDKAGHLVPMERPSIYNRHLKRILASNSIEAQTNRKEQ